MKKLVNILACLVFVFLLTSVSFAKSEKKSKFVRANTVVNCAIDTQCQQARKLAAGVAFQALIACNNPDTFNNGGCTEANNNADRAEVNADRVCNTFPDGPAPAQGPQGPVANYTLKEKGSTGEIKALGLILLPQNAS